VLAKKAQEIQRFRIVLRCSLLGQLVDLIPVLEHYATAVVIEPSQPVSREGIALLRRALIRIPRAGAILLRATRGFQNVPKKRLRFRAAIFRQFLQRCFVLVGLLHLECGSHRRIGRLRQARFEAFHGLSRDSANQPDQEDANTNEFHGIS